MTKIGNIPFYVPGGWQSGTSYDLFQMITLYGSTYISLVASNNTAPAEMRSGAPVDINTTKWACAARAGQDGASFTFADLTAAQIAELSLTWTN